jgi:protoporphyrinogen oxidase
MKTEKIDTVVLGAGPAGLAAGHILAKAGRKPLVVEKGKVAGGLMRSIKRGDFIVDIGRKELYNRLAKVDGMWAEVLGDDYRRYPHRGGILFDGHIIEISPSFRGFRRGMPWSLFLQCGGDLVWWRLRSGGRKASNLEEYFYQKRGRQLTRVISQGFQEKLSGVSWSEIPVSEDVTEERGESFFATMKGLMARTFSRAEVNTFKGEWRHPAKGTGEICDKLEESIVRHGGRMLFDANVLEINSTHGTVDSVLVESGGETTRYETSSLVSSIPAQFLLKHLLKERFDTLEDSLKAPPASKKTIVLVYLFLNEAPHFPHAWLNVTCPNTRIGRITNYAAVGGDMVPAGKTCLCCEFYCGPNDALLAMDNKQLTQLALAECAKYKLLDPAKHFDDLVLRLPGADASQNRHNWMNNMSNGLLGELAPFRNVYYVSRTDLDIATLAGVEAAEAIISGERATFDSHIDPENLDIRSTRKAFEFRNPAELKPAFQKVST